MKRIQLELSNEQTLRLKELRDILAEAVPVDMAGNVEFPVAHYACPGDCTYTCLFSCYKGCQGGCLGTCYPSCTTVGMP